MSNSPKFDQSFWYSGFDGQFFAELIPAQLNYWFISILGGKYFVTSNISIPDRQILSFLQKYKFKFHQATWQYEKFDSFSQNPFLVLASSQQAIALGQLGIHTLPQSVQTSSIQVFESKQPFETPSAYTYFIVTEDYFYLKIGFSKNPSSRLAELQSSRPQALIYLGSFKSTNQRFKDIRMSFEHSLVRNGWYHFTPELRKGVEDLLSQK